METNVRALINLCEQEISNREYNFNHHRRISEAWEEFRLWMHANGYAVFNADIGEHYCEKVFGSTVLSGIDKSDQVRLRAIRMLITYQRDGDFEFRTPSELREFKGLSGEQMEGYIKYLREGMLLSENTISNKTHYLLAFNSYLETWQITLDDLDTEIVSDFFARQDYTLPSKHNCNSTLRLYLRHAFDSGITDKDGSIYILPDNYNKQRKLPTTYTVEEIRSIIGAVERSSAIGKRDYLILLLASEYGWRSSDIVDFGFDQIDWDNNTIAFNLQKTGVPTVCPLLSSVGNAIIDYLKNGRPDTDAKEIIVSGESSKKGKRLTAPTIHSIVTKYMRKANVSNWNQKKHGPHSLRHSLATNLLKKNISISIISTVLDHQSTESTKIYLSVDNTRLKWCALPVPCLNTDAYEEV